MINISTKSIVTILSIIIFPFNIYGQIMRSYDQKAKLGTNTVTSIVQDDLGFIWIGSDNGVARFDGYTVQPLTIGNDSSFVNYINFLKNDNYKLYIGTNDGLYIYDYIKNEIRIATHELLAQNIVAFLQIGISWFVATNNGVYIYNENWQLLYKITQQDGLSNNRVTCVHLSPDKTIWVGTENGLDILKIVGGSVEIENILSGRRIAQVFFDSNNTMWICQSEDIFIGEASAIIQSKNQALKKIAYDTEAVTFFQQHDKVLIGTRGIGISQFKVQGTNAPQNIGNIIIDEDKTNDLKNTILTLFEDNYSNLWIGTLDGLYMYKGNKETQFHTIKHRLDDSNTPSSNIISSICYDSNHNFWLATANGINKLEWVNNNSYKFSHYPDNRDLSNKISNNKIQSVIEYKDDTYFISTKSTVKFFDSKKNIFFDNIELNDSLKSNAMKYVRASFKDNENNIWLAFSEGGIGILDVESDRFQKFNFSKSTDSKHRAICRDRTGKLWISSDDDGLYSLTIDKKTKEVTDTRLYGREQFDRHWITSLYIDKQNRLWAGTSNGLYKYNANTDWFEPVEFPYSKKNIYISGIIEDLFNNIWVAGIKGIYKLSTNGEIQYYDTHSGEDISKTWYILGINIDKNGTIFMGGVNGLSVFNPQEVTPDPFYHKLYISGFEIFNKSVHPDGKRLDEDINVSKKIVLSHKDYQFSITFSSLFYPDPMSVEYAYMLEGFDEDWITTDASRRYVSYSNLKSGDYIFKVRSSNASGIWLENTEEIRITVKPSPWKTGWAYTGYLIIITGIMALIFKMLNLGSKLKYEEALNQWKVSYYINLSYGFKVPLTLIYAPLQRLLKNYNELTEDEAKSMLHVMMQNVKKLSFQISQLMEFRKIDSGKSSLSLAEVNAATLAKDVYNIFREEAQIKKIDYIFESNVDAVIVTIDTTKIEVALYNLISDTIKHTSQNGSIKIHCKLNSADYKLWISITASGITTDNHKRTMEYFNSDKRPYREMNTGIDLSIASDYIRMHHSRIITDNKIEKERTLSFYILLGTSHYSAKELKSLTNESQQSLLPKDFPAASFTNTDASNHVKTDLPLIYLYAGDRELDVFIQQSLYRKYNIEIKDEAFAINTKNALPSLIIIDLPHEDEARLTICQQIKNHPALSNIPVIFLSPLTTDEDKQKAYEMGADAYITKPFDLLYLTTRIDRSLELRKTIKEKIKKELIVNPKEITITSDDEIFLANVMNVIEENISDPMFNVEELAKELNISRSMLYRRINLQTNQPPIEFIKKVRLKRAANLLEVTSYNIAEISTMVGFSDQRYFSSCFKKEYGVNPKKYSLIKKGKEASE